MRDQFRFQRLVQVLVLRFQQIVPQFGKFLFGFIVVEFVVEFFEFQFVIFVVQFLFEFVPVVPVERQRVVWGERRQ